MKGLLPRFHLGRNFLHIQNYLNESIILKLSICQLANLLIVGQR